MLTHVTSLASFTAETDVHVGPRLLCAGCRLKLSASFDEATLDGVLEQAFTSQLAALSVSEYSAGWELIR